MSGNFLYAVKNLSKEENLQISYYLYKLCLDIDKFSNFEEIQTLYNALVTNLGLENNSRKVMVVKYNIFKKNH